MVGGDSRALRRHGDPERFGRKNDRNHPPARGLPRGEDRGRTAFGERTARAYQRRQPPRNGPRRRVCRLGRADDRGHPHPQGEQFQRRAHVPLPGRRPLVRALRPLRTLSGGRGQPRIARHGLRRKDAGQESRLRPGASGTQHPQRAAQYQPPVGHRLVAGQRGGRRPQFRRLLRLDQGLRPLAAGPLRTCGLQQRRPQHRHRMPDVLGLRPVRKIPPEQSPEAADPVRIRACDGQFAGRIRRILGADPPISALSGRIHLGLRGPVAAQNG